MPVSVWKRLPSLLARPEAVYWDLQDPGLVYVLNEPEGMGKIVILVNYKEKINRKKILINNVRTGRRMDDLREFGNRGRYELVR